MRRTAVGARRVAVGLLACIVPLGFPLVTTAWADGVMGPPRHALAMHGEPLHAPGQPLGGVNPQAPKGGTLRLSTSRGFDSLNPYIVRGVPAPGLAWTADTLMARSYDEPFTLYGLLAESVAVADDRSAVEFQLRPEARWHDGSPITVDDVLFSFDFHLKDGIPNRRQYFAKVAKVERVPPRGVRFTFTPGPDGAIDREMPLIMGFLPVMSKAWWSARDPTRTFTDQPFPGSGPYRVAEAEPGRRIVYQRDPDYWGRDLPIRRGLFNPDTVIHVVFRDDTAALEAFLAGDVDLRIEEDPARWATAYDGPAIADGRIVLEAIPHRRPEPAKGFVFNTRRAPFRSPAVREALDIALNRHWLRRAYFHGVVAETHSLFPNSELAATDVADGPDDMREARRRALSLLEGEGWRLVDTRLVDAAGRPFAFEILINDPRDERLALSYARDLDRIGVRARVRVVDAAQYRGRLDDFDFDVTVGGWSSSASPGNEQLFYHGSEAARTRGSRNIAGVVDPAIDALAASIARAVTRDDLVSTARALDHAVMAGHYFAPLFHSPVDRIAHWSRMRRPDAIPSQGLPLEAWWVDPEADRN